MVFSSFIFLCFFLPVVLIGHTAAKNQMFKNGLLALASLCFYAFGEPVYVLLLIASVIMNRFFGIGVSGKRAGLFLRLAIICNLSLLFIFKYLDFVTAGINRLTGSNIPLTKLSLPIGISFYTFQALSYVIDVYRGKSEAQRSFFKLFLYISFFPQLIAGPIVKYHDIAKQINVRRADAKMICEGIYRFTCGLAKKILIANVFAYAADTVYALESGRVGMLAAWIGAISYLFQIYFDFSGYSDMAIGLGKMFGFSFAENFNYPYIAESVRDFWHRWHISLSTWFKEYLYIPLGGNRKGKLRTIINRYIVFAATGIWHGANFTFLVWGLFHGTLLVLEGENVIPVKKCRFRLLNRIYTLLAVTLGFVIFRAESLSQAGGMIAAMFGFGAKGINTEAMEFLTPFYLLMLIVATAGAGDLVKKAVLGIKKRLPENAAEICAMLSSLLLVALCFMRLASESYNPFIYFRF